MRLHGEEIQLSIWVVDHDGKDSEFPFAISILVTVAVLSQMFVTKAVGLVECSESVVASGSTQVSSSPQFPLTPP